RKTENMNHVNTTRPSTSPHVRYCQRIPKDDENMKRSSSRPPCTSSTLRSIANNPARNLSESDPPLEAATTTAISNRITLPQRKRTEPNPRTPSYGRKTCEKSSQITPNLSTA